MNLFVIFITGLTTGGLTCAAMQGGLLASVIANQKGEAQKLKKLEPTKSKNLAGLTTADWQPVAVFLIAKLAIHTVFGFFLGALGSVLTLSLGVRLAFQLFAAFFMFATAMNLLNVHPIFRFVAIQPPRFIRSWLKKTVKNESLFAPFVLGMMTILIPCGVTQAMEILVVSNGNALQGALVMFAFILGTSPVFALIGLATAKLSDKFAKLFYRIAAAALIFMALYNVNGALIALDSPLSITRLSQGLVQSANTTKIADTTTTNGVQKVQINISNTGYSPRSFSVKAGTPVELTLATTNTYSCAASFVMRGFNIQALLKPTDTQAFTFTPTTPGVYAYSCSMGMYTGTMTVL